MTRACRSQHFRIGAVLLIAAGLSAGCSSLATRRGFYDPVIADVRTGDYEAAAAKLEVARESGQYANKDRLLYFIDAGLAAYYAGDAQTSNEKLHLGETAAEELFTRSISRAAATVLLNDNVLEYAGEDYEILYTNLIKALNYLALGKFDDAFVEVRRANEKLELLELKYGDAVAALQEGIDKDSAGFGISYEAARVRFHNDAFARYLSMHLYAADGKWDDARIDYDLLRQAFAVQPYVYGFPMPDVRYQSEEGAILSVVAVTGLAPRKEALNLRLRTDKDLGLVQILYTDPQRKDTEYGHLPLDVRADYYFKFAIPVLVPRPSVVERIRILAGTDPIGELQLLEDVSSVAGETFDAKKTLMYIRAVARAVAKGLATHKLKEQSDTGGLEGWLKKLAIDAGADLTENADLRSSQLLPGRVHVGDFDLAPGTYDITVEFYAAGDQLITRKRFPEFRVTRRGLNLIQAHLPN